MILIVRHGPKRGREPRYNQAYLKAVKRRDPALYRQIRFHETGSPPPSLDGVRAIVFWLGDPLRELYPACFAEAVAIADEARARGLTLVNPPEALSNSIKSVQSGLWRAAGIPTPPYTRCADRAALVAHLDTADLPLLVRRDEQHGQRPTRVCQSRAEAVELAQQYPHFPSSVAPIIDVRKMYRDAGRDDVWAAFHHVKRAYVIGAAVVPQRIFFSASMIASARSSTYMDWRKKPYFQRILRGLPPQVMDCVRAEADFRTGPTEAPDLMRWAAAALGLQYAAIDYASLPDGKIMLWEANPYGVRNPVRKKALWRVRNVRQQYAVIDAALADYFRGLLDLGETSVTRFDARGAESNP